MHIVDVRAVRSAGSPESSNAILAAVPESVRARGNMVASRTAAGRPTTQGPIPAEAMLHEWIGLIDGR